MTQLETAIENVLAAHPYPVEWETTLLSGFHCRGCGKHQAADENGEHPDPDRAHRAHQAEMIAQFLTESRAHA